MKKTFINILFPLAAIAVLLPIAPASAAGSTLKNYDGVITHINFGDGSFIMRLRDGTNITVMNPFLAGTFLSIKGLIDPQTGNIANIANIIIKSPTSSDAIPNITSLSPGSGQVTDKITVFGTGFLKNNSIWVGDVKNAIINVPSKDGKTLSFNMPSAPCNQKALAKCPTTVIPQGNYMIAVANTNGVSNGTSLTIVPMPPLTIRTDILPQITGGSKQKVPIAAIGGVESYNWRISDGALPPGMLLSRAACTELPCRSSGIISGVPTTPGNYQFTVTLASGAETASHQFILTVIQPINGGIYY